MFHDSTHSQFRTVAGINSLVGFQLYLLWAIPTFHCGDLAVDACIISRVVTNHGLTPECFKWLFYSHQNASACLSVLEKRFKAKRDTQKRHAMTQI